MCCLLAGCVSRDNFEGRDLSALKPEKESKVCLTTWKVAFEVTGHDGSVTRPIKAERLACVRVFGRGFGLPLLDGNEARVGAALILHHSIFREAPPDRIPVELVGGEVRGNWFGKSDSEALGHVCLHRFGQDQNSDFI